MVAWKPTPRMSVPTPALSLWVMGPPGRLSVTLQTGSLERDGWHGGRSYSDWLHRPGALGPMTEHEMFVGLQGCLAKQHGVWCPL